MNEPQEEVYDIYIDDSALNRSGYTRFTLRLLNGNSKGTVTLYNEDPGRIIYCDLYRSDYPKTIQAFKDKLLASSKHTTDELLDDETITNLVAYFDNECKILKEDEYSGFFRGVKQQGQQKKEKKLPRIEDLVMSKYHFKTMKDTKEIYYYDEKRGIYVNDGDIIIQIEAEIINPSINTAHVTEVVNHVRRRTYTDRSNFDSNPDIINVKNGLLNIWTRELKPHSPTYLSLIQMPVKYNRKARCPKIIKFIKDVFSDNKKDISIMIRLFGYILLRNSSKYEKSVMFVGGGSNGKSIMIKLIEAFVGEEYCSHVSLQDLNSEKHKFMVAELFGKLVNAHADIPSDDIANSGMFKAIVSGDTIFGEKKHKDPFAFKNQAKLFFSANTMPETSDQTYAFYRRWVILHFGRYFTGMEKNEDLIYELITESELSGLLNMALTGMERLVRDHGFEDKPINVVRDQMYGKDKAVVKEFLNDMCVIDLDKAETHYTLKPALIYAFEQYCNSKNKASLNDINDLDEELIKQGIVAGRVKLFGIKYSAYKGVMTVEEYQKKISKEKLSKNKNKQRINQQEEEEGQGTIF